ncbi:MAG TPA: isoprenylcysteine carboxylmethyltransferase family protein [Anaerolineales bacterium]
MIPVYVFHPVAALSLVGTYLVWLVPEVIRSLSRRPVPGARTQDRRSGLVLALSIWAGVALATLAAFRMRDFAIAWHRMGLFIAGIVLMLAGVAFRWYAIRVLGRFFSVVVAFQPGQTVVQAGPYRRLRHPAYSGAILTLFGLGLVCGNWLSLLALVLLPGIGYGYRIAVEEKMLLAELGDTYRQYMKRTQRIIPFVI